MKHYNFELAMSAVISDQVVQEMVASVVEKQTGKKVKNINAIYNDSVFAGYSVTFHAAGAKPQSFKPSKDFIVETFGAE